MSDEVPKIESQILNIRLNKGGVVGPALEALRVAIGAIVVSLRSVEEADLSGPIEINGPGITFRLEDGNATEENRRSQYRSWLLAKGFQDLSRGLRDSLQEAFLWVGLMRLQGKKVPNGDFGALVQALKQQANALNFPSLVAAVNAGLEPKLHWEAQFLSFQKVRNCLEHRNGVVSERHDTGDNTKLVLSIPRMKLFIQQGDEEIELAAGLKVEGPAPVMLKATTREREYAIGERIDFTSDDFGEIAFACWMMVQDLAQRLPTPAAVQT